MATKRKKWKLSEEGRRNISRAAKKRWRLFRAERKAEEAKQEAQRIARNERARKRRASARGEILTDPWG